MKKILVLLIALALLTLTACISKDATKKLQETPPSTNPVTPPSTTTGGGIGGTDTTVTLGPELLKNGDFSTNTGWIIDESFNWGGPGANPSGANIDVIYDSGAAVIEIVKGDEPNDAWKAKFYTTTSLTKDKKYTVSFEYSATMESTFVFSVEKDGGNPSYLNEPGDKKAVLKATTTKKTYSNTFTGSDDAAAQVMFQLSKAPTGAKITIDNVSLKEQISVTK